MNNDFEILNDFKGFGIPNGKIWFVGLEEAADFKNNYEEILKEYAKGYFPFKAGSIEEDAKSNGNHYTQIYSIMAKIITGLFPTTDWRTYRRESLLTKNGNEFQMNLYPLGEKNLKTSFVDYEKMFGFKNKPEYLDIVKKKRFPILFEFWKQHAPEFTICFGIGNIDDFKKAFHLGTGKPLMNAELVLFEKERVIITPFFGNQNMGQNKIDETLKIIKPFIH
ncbi:MAG TPA: hypothetical protein VFI29_19035 [Hanamia sp.]|nr:hypothetical protein [Hanamia sp.]